MEKKRKKTGPSSKLNPEPAAETSGEPSAEEKKAGPPAYLKFTGIAFEMVATIGVATYGGYLLDNFLNLKFPVFLLSFAMLSLAGSLYLLYKRLPGD